MVAFTDLPKSIQNDIYVFASPWKQYKTDHVLKELKEIVLSINSEIMAQRVVDSIYQGTRLDVMNYIRNNNLSVKDPKMILRIIASRK